MEISQKRGTLLLYLQLRVQDELTALMLFWQDIGVDKLGSLGGNGVFVRGGGGGEMGWLVTRLVTYLLTYLLTRLLQRLENLIVEFFVMISTDIYQSPDNVTCFITASDESNCPARESEPA